MPYQWKRKLLSDKESGRLTASRIKKNFLITGLPGVGKTTLIKKLSEALKPLHPVGFYTAVSFFNPFTSLIIIDEIGKMECLSDQFKRLLKEILDSRKWVVATIALKGSGLIAEIKGRNDVQLFEITKKNRDSLLKEISDFVSQTHQPDEGAQSSLVKWE